MRRLIIIILFVSLTGLCMPALPSYAIVLSLGDSIMMALRNNTDIRNYYDSYESSQLSLGLEESEFTVTVTPNISYSAEDGTQTVQTYGVDLERKIPFGTTFGASVQTNVYKDDDTGGSYSSMATVSVTQPLLKGAGTLYNTASLLSATESNIQQARSLELAKQSLVIDCVSSYCSIIEYQQMRQSYEKSYERAKELLTQAKVKLEIGTVSKMDVYRAELAMLEAKNSLITYEETISNAVDDFKLLLGMPLDSELVLNEKVFNYDENIIDLDDALETAINNRLELKTYKENIAAYERNVLIAKSNLAPPLDLTLSANFLGTGDVFSESTNLNDEGWSVAISSSFDIERKSERVGYLNSIITLNRQRRELNQYMDEIRLEVKSNHRNVLQNYKKINLQKKSVQASEKQLEFTLLRYSSGDIDNLGVIEAEENVTQARIQYYSAITNYIVSRYRLKKSIGTLDVTIYE